MYPLRIRSAPAHDTGHLLTQLCPNWKKWSASLKITGFHSLKVTLRIRSVWMRCGIVPTLLVGYIDWSLSIWARDIQVAFREQIQSESRGKLGRNSAIKFELNFRMKAQEPKCLILGPPPGQVFDKGLGGPPNNYYRFSYNFRTFKENPW